VADLLHIDCLALVGEGRIVDDHEVPANAAERCDDLLDHPVGEIFLLRVAGHIGVGQHCNRRLVGEGCAALAAGHWIVPPILKGSYRLAMFLTCCSPRSAKPIRSLVPICAQARDANCSELGERLQSGCDIDCIAQSFVALHHDVADVDANPKPHLPTGRSIRILLCYSVVHYDRTLHAVHGAKGADLVLPHQTAVALDVGCETEAHRDWTGRKVLSTESAIKRPPTGSGGAFGRGPVLE